MTRPRAIAAAAGALLPGLAAAAIAQPAPALDLARCPNFNPIDARRAISAELTVPAEHAPHLDAVTIALACPDAITATVTVTPAPDDGPLEKTLDLGDVPGELRLRLVALAVAELVEVAAGVAATAAATAPPPPPPPLAPPSVAPAGEGGLDARPFEPPTVHGAVRERSGHTPEQAGTRRALWGQGVREPDVGGRVGLRVYGGGEPMREVAIEGARGAIGLELFVATRAEDDPLGRVRATVGGAGAQVTLACRGGAGTWLCAGARGAAGVAVVTTAPAHPMIVADDLVTSYVELGPRVEVRVEGARWRASAALGVGWSAGLAAFSDGREVVRLSGPVAAVSLGVGWAP